MPEIEPYTPIVTPVAKSVRTFASMYGKHTSKYGGTVFGCDSNPHSVPIL